MGTHHNASSNGVELELLHEFDIDPPTTDELRSLLEQSFPETAVYSERSYFKQLPPRRIIGRRNGRVVAQCGLEHRVVGIDGTPRSILGVIDLCVLATEKDKGIASAILRFVDQIGTNHGIDFIMLFADDRRLYEKNGYKARSNRLSWLRIHDHRMFGIAEELVPELMVRELQPDVPWPEGRVDLLGYLF